MKNSLLLIIFFLLFSCEYKLDTEYFVKIDPPAPSHQISLELVEQTDTILVFNNLNIQYNFNTYGLNTYYVKFTIENVVYDKYPPRGSFTLNSDSFEPGFHTLVAEIYTHSGTGSIGDISGTEGYYSKKNWIILADNRMAPTLSMYESITKEGYLKISWDKCNQYNFLNYNLRCPNLVEYVFYNADSCYYIDKNFVGGEKYYQLICTVASNNWNFVPSWAPTSLSTSFPIPTIQFNSFSDSLKIFWHPSKFKCKYNLSNGNSILSGTIDTSITISLPKNSQRFYLFTVPYNNVSDNEIFHYQCLDSKLFGISK
jgi:hypothetical protein